MLRRHSSLLGLLALFTTAAVLLAACAGEEPTPEPAEPSLPEEQAPEAGAELDFSDDPEPAPDFERPLYDGEVFRLSDHEGEVVVINFWATWCVPCRVEMPEFIELQEEYGDDGLLFVGVSLDEEGFEAARPFAEEIGVNYPIVVDDGEIADDFGGIYGLPATFLVDRSGQIQKRINGRVEKEDLEPMLAELLAEEAV